MTNYVYHRVTLTGPVQAINQLRNGIKTDHPPKQKETYDGQLIFSKKEGTETSYGYLCQKTNTFTHNRQVLGSTPPSDWTPDIAPAWTNYFDFNKIIPTPPLIFTGDLSTDDKKTYPNRNWYEWNTQHWGTKWNSCDTKVDEQGRIHFSAAWSVPKPVLFALSYLFPELTLTVEYMAEGYGFWGIAKFINGELISNNNNTYYQGCRSSELLQKIAMELRKIDITKEHE